MHELPAIGYLGPAGLADALGVSRAAVYKWRSRYPADSSNPFPEPDVDIDGSPGWLPDRLDEVHRWRESLPGRGAGGGRPPASRRTYLATAATQGLGRDEALRTLAAFAEEFPEKTESDIQAWLVDSWRTWYTAPADGSSPVGS